jgi:hypothetical protein
MGNWILKDRAIADLYVADIQDRMCWRFTGVPVEAKQFDTKQEALDYKDERHGSPPAQLVPVEKIE